MAHKDHQDLSDQEGRWDLQDHKASLGGEIRVCVAGLDPLDHQDLQVHQGIQTL